MSGPEKSKLTEGMVYFPAAKFMMGSPEGPLTQKDETPMREIEVSAFYLDKHEATNAEWNAVMGGQKRPEKFQAVATECGTWQRSIVAKGDDAQALYADNVAKAGKCGLHVELNSDKSSQGSNPSPQDFDGPNQPVVVTWSQADAYCKARGKRLPTEAEWERGAKGLTKGYDQSRLYPTPSGKLTEAEVVNVNRTADVCSKPENDAGLCDMAGNVWEWVNNWYDENDYKTMSSKDPQGPTEGRFRVLRGGGFWHYDHPEFLRAAGRNDGSRGSSDGDGVRCASSEDPKNGVDF